MGYALLTAKNYKSDLSPRVNVVFGELLLRDGPYRSPREVSLHLIGVYEWATGVLVLIGDVLFEDVQSAVQKLYTAFNDAHTHGPAHSLTAQNITQEAFIQALAPRFTEHRKQFAGSRPNAQRHKGVASQCPFIASFAIARGSYSDSLPQENEYTSLSTGPGAASPGQGVPDPSGASILESARGDVGADIAPGFLSNGVGPPAGAEEHVSEQDEMVRMHGTFESDACKTKMTIELSTLDTDKLFGKAINYTLLVTVVAFAQVIVLIRQMEMTSTQAGARRVSLMTVGLQAVADSYLCLGHLTMGIAVQSLFNAFATAAFFKFICFSIFLMRWMLLIWKARRPSGFSEGWEAMRRELSMLYSRFYGSLLLGIFLLYQMQNHIRLFVFALYAFWVPQIILNVVEDHRRPLLPIYIIATSVTRLAIPLYFWGCPQNFLHIQPQPSSVMALVAWLAIQVIILLSQYKFGPRWFIPKAFLPEKYDYYRPLPMGDEGLEDDIEAQEGTREEDEEGSDKRPLVGGMSNEPKRECCICMESVGVHARDRMVTPCNHFFHAICLERWLEVRLECALCRTAVPPP
ncbi:unnamed protein product [Chondrus crispus]|uniref:RING-type E3 ubiquitin transferase n=1 Tax=Chondrus crispus TaxID=2769 RepID=R7Q198_CHOCR|nr:unnamed protein product [Chondrus crispus]CDF32392.1 unnamed protein product [Chondrus crispus]|eukprot:XP_005712057.1 unnamed protein product [Chondrus crispus]